MPRTKGAKNKPKSKEYLLQKLAELGENVPQTFADVVTPVAKTKKKFELQKVDEVNENQSENETLSGEILRCGNPACGKILNEQYNICPFCGVNLQWQ